VVEVNKHQVYYPLFRSSNSNSSSSSERLKSSLTTDCLTPLRVVRGLATKTFTNEPKPFARHNSGGTSCLSPALPTSFCMREFRNCRVDLPYQGPVAGIRDQVQMKAIPHR
jgi:hypothetical protein